MATQEVKVPEQPQGLVEKLGMDPSSDMAVWIRQQEAAGVKNADILFTLAEGTVTPARFKRVPLDE